MANNVLVNQQSKVIPFLKKAKSLENKLAFLESAKGDNSLNASDRKLVKKGLVRYAQEIAKRSGDYCSLVESLRYHGDSEKAFSYLANMDDSCEDALELKITISINTGHYEAVFKYSDLLAQSSFNSGRNCFNNLSQENEREALFGFMKALTINSNYWSQLTPEETEFCREGIQHSSCCFHRMMRKYGRQYYTHLGEYGKRNSSFLYWQKRGIKDRLDSGKYRPSPGLSNYFAKDKEIQLRDIKVQSNSNNAMKGDEEK